MAIKIRKQYKNDDGTITEVEGTEEEIAKYERKRDKKKDESTTKKKDILYGKEHIYVPYYVPVPSQPALIPCNPYPSYPWTVTCDSSNQVYSSTTYEIKC